MCCVPTRVLAVPDRVFEQASQGRLRELAGLTPAHIATAARELVGLKQDDCVQDAFSHRASLSGRLGGIGSVPWRSARYAFDAGEVIVNPIGGASSLSAEAGTDAVTTLFPPRNDWSGLANASGRLGVSLDDRRLGALRPLPGSSPRTKHAVQPDGDPRPRGDRAAPLSRCHRHGPGARPSHGDSVAIEPIARSDWST